MRPGAQPAYWEHQLIEVTLSGIPAGMVFENSPLTADVATDGEDLRTIRYQWLADGEVVATTNENTFRPAGPQVGKAMSVKLLYTDPAGAEHQVGGSNALTVLDVTTGRPAGSKSCTTRPIRARCTSRTCWSMQTAWGRSAGSGKSTARRPRAPRGRTSP
jgi:hypothetical protein